MGWVSCLTTTCQGWMGSRSWKRCLAEPALAERHAIILVSAYAPKTVPLRLRQLLTALSVDKVDKPFDLDDLCGAVAKAVQRCQSPPD
jgi:hypothetical protein